MTGELFRVRPARPDDAPFIGTHWVMAQSNLEASQALPGLSSVCRDHYPRVQNRVIDRLLSRTDVVTRVAHKPDNDAILYGFSCISPGHVHFVFVRPSLRGMGVAQAMIDGIGPLDSCSVRWLGADGNPRLEYRPELSW